MIYEIYDVVVDKIFDFVIWMRFVDFFEIFFCVMVVYNVSVVVVFMEEFVYLGVDEEFFCVYLMGCVGDLFGCVEKVVY